MTVQEILESVQFVVNNQGQQTAIQMDLAAWEALRQLLEDLEDIAEIEQARQEEEELFDWATVVAEHQAKYTLSSDVQD